MKQIPVDNSQLTKEQRIKAFFEGSEVNAEKINRKIRRTNSCPLRTVYSIVDKLKNRESLNRKVRSDKNTSSLVIKKKRIQKLISQPSYIDCTIIKKKMHLKESRQAIRNFIVNNDLES